MVETEDHESKKISYQKREPETEDRIVVMEEKKQNLECCKYWDEPNEINSNSLDDIKKGINSKDFEEFQKEIEKYDIIDIYENKYTTNTIGPINDIGTYINSLNKELEGIEQINKDIPKHRQIKGDGNCFFRAVIFYFLENIIISNDKSLMKCFIILFNKKMNLNEDIIDQVIQPDIKNKIVIILLIILRYMEENKNDKYSKDAYVFYLKAFLFSYIFDKTLIFFTRYLVYDFMKLNENKIIDDFEISNSLPDQYIKSENGKNEYMFKQYYEKHLLKMKEFAQDCDIIMIPYVLKCNLNILNLHIENNKFILGNYNSFKCGVETDKEINLLYHAKHYSIYYKKDYYDKYSNELNNIRYKIDYDDIRLLPKIKAQVSENIKSYKDYLSSKNLDDNKDNLNIFFSDIKLKDSNILLFDVINTKNLNLEDIIKELNQCSFCGKTEITQIFKTLPCGCKICSNDCFREYLKPKINKGSLEHEDGKYYDHITYCKCGQKNIKKDIKEIIAGKENINTDDEDIEDPRYQTIVENHWKWKCNLCEKNESFDRRFRYYRLIFKEEKNPFTKKELEHLVCFTCKNEKIKGKEVFCIYCDKNHKISSIKNVSEDNENESSCAVI